VGTANKGLGKGLYSDENSILLRSRTGPTIARQDLVKPQLIIAFFSTLELYSSAKEQIQSLP
jgi:hypothetical protein